MTAILYFVRHGETVWNKRQILQGHLDSDLTETGIKQTHQLGKRLKDFKLDRVYASDLGRASKTARIIADYLEMPVKMDTGLRERNLGIFQGLLWDETERRFPDEYWRYRNAGPDYRIPNGESWNEAEERIIGTIRHIAVKNDGQRALVVTHGGLMNILFRHVLQIPHGAPRRFTLKNSSISKLIITNGEWWLDILGDTHHLNGDGKDDIY